MSTVATEQLRIPIGMLRDIKQHALGTVPLECCGLLGGPEGMALMLAKCGNRAPLPEHNFFIDAFHQFRAEQQFNQRGFAVIGMYHSHPTRNAEPSDSDLSNAPSKFVSIIYSVPLDECRAWRGSTAVDLEVIR